jgi:hypothetical protein
MELELQPNKQNKTQNQINKICTLYIIYIIYCFNEHVAWTDWTCSNECQ